MAIQKKRGATKRGRGGKRAADPRKATPKALATDGAAAQPVPLADEIPVYCAHGALLPIGDLKPYPGNINDHPEVQVLRLAKLILHHGWRTPITVSTRSGYIVRGHGRLAAARRLNVAVVPVDFQPYADERTERADRAADNLIADLAEINRQLAKELVLDMDDGSFDLDLLGQTPDFFEDLLTAAPPEQPPEDPPPTAPDAGDDGGGGDAKGGKLVQCPSCGTEFTPQSHR